ncbi:hypothetical protein ACP4OV_030343 [Aristida adscensionis]
MDGADAFAVSPPSSPWALVRGYFSPATLFVLLNVVIGTIALTSRSHRAHRDDHDDSRHQYHHHHQQQQHYSAPPPPAPLARTSSMMERLRSLGLYRFRSGDFPPEYNHHLSSSATADAGAQPAQAQYARSRSEPAARPPPVRRRNKKDDEVAAAAKRPSSEARKLQRAPPRPRAVVLVRDEAAAASVDARADDFINRFRQQLQLQRLNSLLNYREMLNRGT